MSLTLVFDVDGYNLQQIKYIPFIDVINELKAWGNC